MKSGRSIVSLAQEIDRRAQSKRDLVADTRELSLTDSGNSLTVGNESFEVSHHTHRQIGDRLGIPAKYYDRMKTEAPDLLEMNVNKWLHDKPERRMVRTLDGAARAFLSDRYRRIDNEDIAQVVLPILMESSEIQVISSEVTERRMYIQAVFPGLEADIKVGDAVQSGIIISNSEIGSGSFAVSPLVYRLVCTNGMIASTALKKYHVGRQAVAEDGSFEIFSDETIKADDEALFLKVRDVVRSSLNEATFNAQVEQLREATQTSTLANPVKGVEVLGKKFGLGEGEQQSVLQALFRGDNNHVDYSKYGVIQAVTAVANTDSVNYDRAVELEQLGGKVLNLPSSEWNRIAEAA